MQPEGNQVTWDEIMVQTYDLAGDCLKTNYYGAKRMVEALVPLLELSNSARIVNVSSSIGKWKHIPSERVKGLLRDVESLTEAKVDELLTEYLQDFKEGSLETKGWPSHLSPYIFSKAAMVVYTRMQSNKYPNFFIYCVCPGFVKTDITCNSGQLTADICRPCFNWELQELDSFMQRINSFSLCPVASYKQIWKPASNGVYSVAKFCLACEGSSSLPLDCNSKVSCMFSCSVGSLDSNTAEFLAIHMALSLESSQAPFTISKLVIESDSSIALGVN